MIRSVDFSAEELKTGIIGDDNLKKSIEIYTVDGCLLLNNVLPVEYVKNLNSSYNKRYGAYFKNKDHKDALEVGHQRYMITVTLETPFSSQKIYANPLVYPIIKSLLGNKCIINGFGSVVSLPGAFDQQVHYDHPPLFEVPDIDRNNPSHAITVIFPLVELNAQTGTTVMMPKSHRFPQDKNADYGLTYDFPTAPLGSCLLMDFRLRHYGMANQSDTVRPILYNIYSKPWFRDYKNYDKQSALTISRKDYDKIPDVHRHLFLFAKLI